MVDDAFKKREREKARALGNPVGGKQSLVRGSATTVGYLSIEDDLTMDHIVPVARGGRSVKGNVAVSCKPCNTDKRTSTPVEDLLAQISGGDS